MKKQELEVQLLQTQQQLQESRVSLEVEKEHFDCLVADWNALVTMLGRVLNVQVYSDGNLWFVEYSGGKKSTGHQTVAGAFEEALKEEKP